MKKYKIRITGLGIEATAIIPFEVEPTNEQVENKLAEYLNELNRTVIFTVLLYWTCLCFIYKNLFL